MGCSHGGFEYFDAAPRWIAHDSHAPMTIVQSRSAWHDRSSRFTRVHRSSSARHDLLSPGHGEGAITLSPAPIPQRRPRRGSKVAEVVEADAAAEADGAAATSRGSLAALVAPAAGASDAADVGADTEGEGALSGTTCGDGSHAAAANKKKTKGEASSARIISRESLMTAFIPRRRRFDAVEIGQAE